VGSPASRFSQATDTPRSHLQAANECSP
jgi:hypothetical protein